MIDDECAQQLLGSDIFNRPDMGVLGGSNGRHRTIKGVSGPRFDLVSLEGGVQCTLSYFDSARYSQVDHQSVTVARTGAKTIYQRDVRQRERGVGDFLYTEKVWCVAAGGWLGNTS